MVILKIEWNNEIRRVGFETNKTTPLVSLRRKLDEMLPIAGKSISVQYRDTSNVLKSINNNEDCITALADAETRTPSMLRVVVVEDITADCSGEPAAVEEAPCCSVCRVQLGNVYFKCLNCVSGELCEECERKELHNEQHLLVKLRCPLSALPAKQQLVFERHIEENASQHKEKRSKKRVIKQLRRVASDAETKPILLAGEVVPIETEDNMLMSDFQLVKEATPTNDSIVVEEPPVGFPCDSIIIVEENPEQPKVEEQPEVEVNTEKKEPTSEEKPTVPEQPREEPKPHLFKQNLNRLVDMGFTDHDRNIRLLVKHVGDLEATVEELLHSKSWLPVFGS